MRMLVSTMVLIPSYRTKFLRCYRKANTLYMEAALQQVRAEGLSVASADVARLSPLVHQHINFQGRYSFTLSEAVAHGELRPLRNPSDLSEDEEWEMGVA